MPRIDPFQLLRCLSVLLSPIGGIKSKDEVQRLQSLMVKFSKKLVSKCIYVLILKTTDADLLDMFMSAGGWDLTFNWLNDGIQSKNWPLVTELVELLLLCPVDIGRLKGNNCPKAIKTLSKDPTATEKVRQLAGSVVEQWLAIVKGVYAANAEEGEEEAENSNEADSYVEGTGGEKIPMFKIKISEGKNVIQVVDKVKDDNYYVDSPDASESSDSSEVKRKTVDHGKNKTEPKRPVAKKTRTASEEYDAKIKDKKKALDKLAEKRMKIDLKNRQKEREKEKIKEKATKSKQEEKDRAVLSKLMTPSLVNVGKIPKKAKDDDKKTESVKPKDTKKYNISIEERKLGVDRPKTVKTFNSKFRSTGLEEPPPPPKSKKIEKEKKDVPEKRHLKRSSPSHDDHHHAEKKPREDKHEKPKEEKPQPTPPAPPAKPKGICLLESDAFADALTAVANVKDVKKRKRRPSDSKKESHSPTQTKSDEIKPVFKFYQDTLITNDEKKQEKVAKVEPMEEEADISQITQQELEEEVIKAEEAISQQLKQEKLKNAEREKNRIPKGVLVYFKKTGKAVKKMVKWRADNELEEVQYFEFDETERVNVTRTFTDMKQMERANEGMLLSRKIAWDDVMEEKIPWYPLIPVDVEVDLAVEPGKNSIEREIQLQRESTTMPVFYLSKNMIPDSPAEPDLEIHAKMEPAIIPLEDLTGNSDSVISHRDKPWPEPKTSIAGSDDKGGDLSPPIQQHMDIPPPMMMPPFQPGFPPGPFMQPGTLLPNPEWAMQNGEMMINSGMGPGIQPSMPPNLLGPPPDMFQMNQMNPMGTAPDFIPPFMNGPPPLFTTPFGGPNGPNGPPPPGPPGPGMHRPWFRNGGPPGDKGRGGSWRHSSQGGNWNNNFKPRGTCNNFLKKGFCRTPKCPYKHGPRNNKNHN